MKNQLTILYFTILSINCFAQISFENAYFIDNSGIKTECLIKNIDWKNNPTEFEYKLSETEEPKTASIESVKEFGIYDLAKYVRDSVNIDRSGAKANKLSNSKNPIFNKEQLYLKVLVEGKATLYYYEDGNLRRFFFKTDTSNIEQLVFKYYLVGSDKIGQNKSYLWQLNNNLKCSSFTIKTVEKVDYEKNDLVKFFVNYNECNSSELTNFDEKQKRDLFNLTIRPGLNISSMSINNSFSDRNDTDFDTEFSFRFGIEAELLLPFNKSKWAFIIEPTYQYYKSEKESELQNIKVDYSSIELPLGLRYYMYINENSKLFANVAVVLDFDTSSTIAFENGLDLEISSGPNFAFGFGYNYNKKYSFELRYLTSRDVLGSYMAWDSSYNTISAIFGFSIF